MQIGVTFEKENLGIAQNQEAEQRVQAPWFQNSAETKLYRPTPKVSAINQQ